MVTIYALTCLANGKAYIGCTRGKIGKRFREHRCNLDAGKHSEKLLLADWRKYGQQMFRMETLFELEEDASLHVLRGMEKYAMKRFKELGLLYNTNESSFEPVRAATLNGYAKGAVVVGRKWTPEANRKRSLAQKGIPKNHGHKISATKKLLGQKPSPEAARLGGIATCKKRWQAVR
ncbi:MAG: GIY-YIG nuclease family protein [Sulfuricaulis sp.]|nr:GIY-YIG nuclease family protein [Sulfuricaulis sp.]